jgi:UDP-glucuronate 4-epimerase
MAHTYSHLYKIKTTGLRFFTVYGPWGRPDMAPFIFVKNIIEGKTITVFNEGNMDRDFTFVDDIVEGVFLVISKDIKRDIYKIYNIGNSQPVNLNDFIRVIEQTVGKKANIHYKPMRQGDVIRTYSDISALSRNYGYQPNVGIKEGIGKFLEWYKEHT